MGKTRRHKIRTAINSNPLGLLASNQNKLEFALDGELQGIGMGPIEAIREQLQNVNLEEKINGLQSLAVIAASQDKVAAVCSTDIVRIAAPLLCERDQAVRNAAAGALRNLSVCSPEVCDYLVEQDVLTPLLVLLNEYTCDTRWAPTFDVTMRGQIDLRSDVFLQAINLLWNLCESTSNALELFNQTPLLEGLVRCLDYKIFGLDIAMSVAQCLLVVSENNPKCWNVLSQHVPELLLLLESTGESGHYYLSTMAAGILANIPALAAAYTEVIFVALARTLEINHQGTLSVAVTAAPVLGPNNPMAELEFNSNMETEEEETEEVAALRRRRQELPTDSDIALQNAGYILDAQRVAAEVITNFFSTDDEEWIDADDDDGESESESVTDYEMTKSENSTNVSDNDKLPPELVEVVKKVMLVDKLWHRSQPIPDGMSQLLRNSSVSLLMKTKNLRISSLLSLQNVCNRLSTDDLGGAQAIYNVWVDLGQQVFKGPRDVTILEPSTALMRAALEHLKTNKELFCQMTESDLELMLDGVKSCSVPEIRANWLRMLGSLGCLLSEPLVKMIISFIVETSSKEDNAWTISEALDALMDMFAENDWNQIIVETNLPQVMKNLDKNFKAKLRQQKRELKERYLAAQTVSTNLSRFIKYTEKEAAKYVNNTKGNGTVH